MTDEQFATYEAKAALAAQREAEILPHNKQILFNTLAEMGIAIVTVDFDGYGDSGTFQEPAAFDSQNTMIAFPTVTITIKTLVFDTGAIEEKAVGLRDFIDTLASGLLDEKHSGWEDGEGAYGQFQFSLADRTIKLEYSERYVDTHYHEYEL